jgi:DNA-binding HxlR family transcriptional regulator
MAQVQSSPGGRPQPSILHEEECRGFQKAVELVGRRWTSAILLALSRGARRFGEILALVDGLSDRLLSQRLKELEAEGLVVRTVVPTTPVQVRYELSGRGRELMIALQPLVNWGIAELRRDPR